MGDKSAIQWTDATWNPITGCTRVSPGCANCYIERTPPFRIQGRRFKQIGQESTTGVTLHPDRLEHPLRWRKPRRVFVCSLADLFHDDVPDDYLVEVFATMALAPGHTFQVLTKRPDRAARVVAGLELDIFKTIDRRVTANQRLRSIAYAGVYHRTKWPLPNVWLGVSIENARYTDRADVLREIPAAVRFVSAEPLLGSLYPNASIPTSKADHPVGVAGDAPEGGTDTRGRAALDLTGIDWVIIGGESGPGARPFHLEHAREIIRACRDATTCRHGLDLTTVCYCQECEAEGVEHERPAVFVKQLGAKPVEALALWHDANDRAHRAVQLRDSKGGDIDEWPADLQIREYPTAIATAA